MSGDGNQQPELPPEFFEPGDCTRSVRPFDSAMTLSRGAEWAAILPPGVWHLEQNPAIGRTATAGTNFQLRKLVGVGGQGEVWEALQTSLGRIVAVKRIRQSLREKYFDCGSETVCYLDTQFRREALTTASLDHPNIVPVYDLGTAEDGTPLLAMKLVRGAAWNEMLRADEALSMADHLAKHLPILVDVAQAVAFAHSRGVMHRDLKPSQVIVGEFGEVQLMDWGMAVSFRELQALPGSGEIPPSWAAMPRASATNPAGTPSFMAPEQTGESEHELGPWTDVFLLGGILYTILTGRLPYEADTPAASIAKASQYELTAPSQRTPDREIPEELNAVCMRAMARDPRDRFPSATAFVAALEDFISGSGRRRESIRLLEEARRIVEPVDTAAEEALIRAFGPLEEALAKWAENGLARELLEYVRIRLRAVRQRRARLKIAVTTGFAIMVFGFTGLSLWLRSEHLVALERQRGQQRMVDQLNRINSLRSAEAALAEQFAQVLPLPTQLLEDGGTGESLGISEEMARQLLKRRAALAGERAQLIYEEVPLEDEPFVLLLGEANLLVRGGSHDRAAAQKAFSLFAAAEAKRPGFPEPQIGMGVAAARAGFPTSATLHLEIATDRVRAVRGETHPEYARVLALTGEAFQNLDSSSDTYRTYYRRSVDVLEPQWAELSLTLGERIRSMSEVGRLLEYTSPALQLARRREGPLSNDYARAAQAVSDDLFDLGRFEESMAMATEALAIAAKNDGEDSPAALEARNQIALCLVELGRYDEATTTFEKIVGVRALTNGKDSAAYGTALKSLGINQYYRGNYQDAEATMRQAITILEKSRGPDDRSTASAYNDLAVVLNELGKIEEAGNYYRHALDSSLLVLGRSHPETATSLNNVGYNLFVRGDYEAALDYFQQALEVRRRKQGDRHPDTAGCFNNVAGALLQLERYDEALPYFAAALVPFREQYGENHPNTAIFYNNIGHCLTQKRDWESAQPLQLASANIFHEAMGADHPMTLAMLRNLAENMGQQARSGRTEFARPALRLALHLHGVYSARPTMVAREVSRDFFVMEAVIADCHMILAPEDQVTRKAIARRLIAMRVLFEEKFKLEKHDDFVQQIREISGLDVDAGQTASPPTDFWSGPEQPMPMPEFMKWLDDMEPMPDVMSLAGDVPFAMSELEPRDQELKSALDAVLKPLLEKSVE